MSNPNTPPRPPGQQPTTNKNKGQPNKPDQNKPQHGGQQGGYQQGDKGGKQGGCC